MDRGSKEIVKTCLTIEARSCLVRTLSDLASFLCLRAQFTDKR